MMRGVVSMENRCLGGGWVGECEWVLVVLCGIVRDFIGRVGACFCK